MKYKNPASLACQVRAAIRLEKELPYQTLAKIFKNEIKYTPKKYGKYILGFFEECDYKLIKNFMLEQDISREDILRIYNMLPEYGEISHFKEAVQDGKF